MSIDSVGKVQRTSDFNVGSILLYFEHQLIEIDRRDPRRCVFVFSWGQDMQGVIDQFFKGALLVDPKRFIAVQKDLKSRIYF
jgi:hypothetical protein